MTKQQLWDHLDRDHLDLVAGNLLYSPRQITKAELEELHQRQHRVAGTPDAEQYQRRPGATTHTHPTDLLA